MLFPATGCLVQDLIGAKKAWAFDVSAACSGFAYALTVGAQFVETGRHKKVMVIGADVMTSILDYKDRTTCVLFGDAAGAVILEPREDGTGILDFAHEVDGSGACYLNMPAGGSLRPATPRDGRRRDCTTSSSRASTSSSTRCASSPTPASRSCSRTTASPGPGRRPVRRPPGQHPHHRGRAAPHGAARREGGQEHPRVRQHHGGHDPARAQDGARPEAARDGHLVLLAAVGAGFTVGTVLLRWSGVSWDRSPG